MKYKLLLIFALFFYSTGWAQLKYFSPETMNGYTLFLGDKLYLVNNCGEVVHSWAPVVPKYHVKLLPNGNIVYIDWTTNTIVERDWNDNLINTLSPADPDIHLEYDVIVLENGNYLCVARKGFSVEDFANIGYDIDFSPVPFQIDLVVELDRNSGETIWQWNTSDHVIQERSDTAPNYGLVMEHPELLNIDAINPFDWTQEEAFMINGMDYNSELDQIVLSLRKMSEIIIIDHSTTTIEAAGHTGGNSGKGGDILYRWGNPQNYNRGTELDQALFFQHNPNWIEYGEHVGKITLYNNGLNRPGVSFQDRYSNAPIITPPIQADGNYEIADQLAFAPIVPIEDYGGLANVNHFYSNYTSASKVLQNGNILISVGDDNRIIELNPEGELLWEYELASAIFTFRVEKYPKDYAAFEGRDLTPMGTIENPPSMVPCETVSNPKAVSSFSFKAWVDASSRQLYIQTEIAAEYDITLYDLLGKKLYAVQLSNYQTDSGQVTFKHQLATNLNGFLILNLKNRETGRQASVKLFLD